MNLFAAMSGISFHLIFKHTRSTFEHDENIWSQGKKENKYNKTTSILLIFAAPPKESFLGPALRTPKILSKVLFLK